MIFVSYAREDREFADRVVNEIEEQLGLEVWTDRRLQAGSEFNLDIQQALERALVVIVLWSRDSVRSIYVVDEATHARNARKLLPVRIDDISPPLGFGGLHTPDLLRTGSARDWNVAPLIPQLVSRVPREVDLPGVLRLNKQQSDELALARRLMQQHNVTLVCGSAESLTAHLFARGLSLMGLRCSSEDEPREASGAEMLPRLQAIGESDLCVVLLYPISLSAWYFEACRTAAKGRVCYLVFGSTSLEQVRRNFPFLAQEADDLFLTDRPLGVSLSGAGLERTWETLRFLSRRLQALPPRQATR